MLMLFSAVLLNFILGTIIYIIWKLLGRLAESKGYVEINYWIWKIVLLAFLCPVGISRSNAYNALAGLVDKGAAYIQEEDTVRYTPVAIEEFCSNKIRHLEQKKTELIAELPGKRKNEGGYLTIKGEEHICDKIIDMLLCAEERAYISVYNERLEMFREHLEKMVSEGKKVVIITNEPFDLQGATVYLTECKKEQIRLITDSKDVLTGAITNRYEATSLYSSNNNLVEVFKDALANEIQLLKMK